MSSRRALVLGSGGVTGLAWQVGVLDAWADAGVAPGPDDLIVGTSAGAIVGAHLALGRPPAGIAGELRTLATPGRVDAATLARLLLAQVARDREAALRRLARRLRPAPDPDEAAAAAERLTRLPPGTVWPAGLRVVVLDARTGRGRVLAADDGVDLCLAVAASAAVPGVLPPVALGGRLYLDGGLASPANVTAAAGATRILVIAPQPASWRRARRPAPQLRALGRDTAWLLATPDAAARRAQGVDPLGDRRVPLALAAGRRQGRALAAVARRVWG